MTTKQRIDHVDVNWFILSIHKDDSLWRTIAKGLSGLLEIEDHKCGTHQGRVLYGMLFSLTIKNQSTITFVSGFEKGYC